MQRSSTANYYLFDGLGSVVSLTDGTGVVRDTYSYDAFGQTTTANAPVANNLRFAGAYQDTTGLYKIGQRYYDPSVGRWTQQDPVVSLVDPLQWNRYVYVGDDPVNFVDPSGTSIWSCIGAIANALLKRSRYAVRLQGEGPPQTRAS